MFYKNQQFRQRYLSDPEYVRLSGLLDDEADAYVAEGGDWADYKPSRELRQAVKDAGYSMKRVRAAGAFPYAIE